MMISTASRTSLHTAISPYLFDAGKLINPHLVVKEVGKPINGLLPLLSGSQPIDDGNYILDGDQRAALLADEPQAANFLKPYLGAREHINGGDRWILALQKPVQAI